jgi:hypothetical protein
MNVKTLGFATLLCAIVSTAIAAPTFTAVPGGVQAGNWVWKIDITPDLSLNTNPADPGTPMAAEFGFRLTGAQLLSATITDTFAWDAPNPGKTIFGWESASGCDANGNPCGLQLNLSTGEIFAAYGSRNITTPGPTHFLTVMTSGPSTGSSSFSSTIQWLGATAYGNNGRVAQITGWNGTFYTTGPFDIFAGSATQSVPEPVSCSLLAIGAIVTTLSVNRRQRG